MTTDRRRLVRVEMILRRLDSSSITSNVLAMAKYGTLGMGMGYGILTTVTMARYGTLGIGYGIWNMGSLCMGYGTLKTVTMARYGTLGMGYRVWDIDNSYRMLSKLNPKTNATHPPTPLTNFCPLFQQASSTGW